MYSYIIHNKERAMKATVVDLRYRMREILKALDRREKVTLLYHGKIKGVITPGGIKTAQKVEDHPFFKMKVRERISVSSQMRKLRGSRFHAL
jgi:hypothetical protein